MKKIALLLSLLFLSVEYTYSQKNDRETSPPIINQAGSGAVQIENDGFRKYGTEKLRFFTPSGDPYEKYSMTNNGIFTIWDENSNQGFGFGVNPSGQLEFIGNGTYTFGGGDTRMSIDDDNGNVGIGVLNPSAKLDILGGNWDLAGTSNGDVRVGSDTYNFRIGVATAGGGAGDVRMFTKGGTNRLIWGNGTSDKMALNSSGYLGIGTIDPTAGLEIQGSSNALTSIKIVSPSASHSSLNLYRSGGTLTTPTATPNAFNLGRINFFGYNGTDFAEGAGIYALSSEVWTATARGSNIRFTTTSIGTTTISERMRIDHNGNVGIGTTTPDNKLDVKGIIRAEEVIVETGWADYVFEKGYQLNNLKTVENFISINKHLPNVPSAKEIKDNGAHVADLMTKMMEKIEELTLYTIQQQKEIEALKLKLETK